MLWKRYRLLSSLYSRDLTRIFMHCITLKYWDYFMQLLFRQISQCVILQQFARYTSVDTTLHLTRQHHETYIRKNELLWCRYYEYLILNWHGRDRRVTWCVIICVISVRKAHRVTVYSFSFFVFWSLFWVHLFPVHSVPECDFEGLKTYQAPAHIWDMPRWWKLLLLMYKIFDMHTFGLSHQIKVILR